MIELNINGQPCAAEENETILAAAKRAGIRIPTLCYMENLPPSGACRVCIVEVEGARGLIPSCAFPVEEGMEVQTRSPRVINARRTIIQLLLARLHFLQT